MLLVSIIFLSSTNSIYAQDPTADSYYQKGRKFMQQGDYDNAALMFTNALKLEPTNYEILKDQSYLSYLKRDFTNAITQGKALIARPDADEQSFQILGMTYKAIAEDKECEKLYLKAEKKFPNSGTFYNDYGELLASQKKYSQAITQWEKGIQVDPNYSSNYYNATQYYFTQGNHVWVLIYGECFLRLESYSNRSAQMKTALVDAYKQLYTNNSNNTTVPTGKKNFEKAVLITLQKGMDIGKDGITPENLLAIRTRFLVDWQYGKFNTTFPFQLFDNWEYLINENLFEAYTQWLFGLAISPTAHELWQQYHEKEVKAFKAYQQNNIYKIPANQYYNNIR